MFTWILLGTALAKAPDGLRPVVAPADAMEQYRQHLQAEGRPESPSLACDPLWPGHALLCFRIWEDGRRRWVTTADLPAWDATVSELRAAVTAEAPEHLDDLEQRPVVDMDAHWWLLADGDGWAAAGVLAPRALAERVGVPLRVAVPAEGVLVAWRPGSEELDKVMAVGVREILDAQSGTVSPMIHTWTGDEWVVFGQATPVEEPKPDAETPTGPPAP